MLSSDKTPAHIMTYNYSVMRNVTHRLG